MLHIRKPSGDMGTAFVWCANAYTNALNNPTHPSWPEIRYFESLGYMFDRQQAPFNELARFENELERIMRVGEPGFMEFTPTAPIRVADEIVLPEWEETIIAPQTRDDWAALMSAVMTRRVENEVMIHYDDLRHRGEPIAFTQDERGHVRFDEPVNLQNGESLTINYTVTLPEELPDI